jgi:hypothetical protein
LFAASKDGKGGSSATGVRWWLKFMIWGRREHPIRRSEAFSADYEVLLREETLLMDFATWLVTCKPSGRRISPKTASKYVSQVQGWHRRHYGVSIGGSIDKHRLRELIKGLRNQLGDGPKRVRYGVRTQDLRKGMDSVFKRGSRDDLAWCAAMQTAFCGLMRGGEFALQTGEAFDAAKHLSRADLTFFRDEKGVLHAVVMMRPLKSERARSKSVPIILAEGGSILDPVRALWDMVASDPVSEEERESTPLFRHGRGKRLAFTVAQVRDAVKRVMRAAGQDPSRFGAHSLRIGGATAALAADVSPSLIRLMGRWASDIYEIYTRVSREAVVRMSVMVASTPFHDVERGFVSEELETVAGEVMLADADLDMPDEDEFEGGASDDDSYLEDEA